MTPIIVSRSGQESAFDPDKTTNRILQVAKNNDVKLTSKTLVEIRETISKKVTYLFQSSIPSSKIEEIIHTTLVNKRNALNKEAFRSGLSIVSL